MTWRRSTTLPDGLPAQMTFVKVENNPRHRTVNLQPPGRVQIKQPRPVVLRAYRLRPSIALASFWSSHGAGGR